MATVVEDTIQQELVGTWDIDTSHSNVEAVARYAMLLGTSGHGSAPFSGSITRGRTLEDSHVEVEIDAASIDTSNEKRDGHLRSEDFMHVDQHPTIAFRSTRVEQGGGADSYKVFGDFTMRGVTKGVELDVEFDGVGPDPWGNTRASVHATTTINRKDWGVSWNAAIEAGGVLVSDKLKIDINVSAIKRREARTRSRTSSWSPKPRVSRSWARLPERPGPLRVRLSGEPGVSRSPLAVRPALDVLEAEPALDAKVAVRDAVVHGRGDLDDRVVLDVDLQGAPHAAVRGRSSP